ncbi:hypothetical protein DL98DRAFT_564669 [Cadophora sp. DSE1049]|nr:hypothetical protein DL98DRAFT_564669 [Cadophora sp. DSE1049]
MTSLVSSPPVPSELDDEVDDADLPLGHKWAYPCKLPSCPDYGRSWKLRSKFLLYLQETEAHEALATTPAVRRAIEIDWRYTTDPYLPPRAALDKTGRAITGRGTQKQIEMHMASREEGTPDV